MEYKDQIISQTDKTGDYQENWKEGADKKEQREKVNSIKKMLNNEDVSDESDVQSDGDFE